MLNDKIDNALFSKSYRKKEETDSEEERKADDRAFAERNK